MRGGRVPRGTRAGPRLAGEMVRGEEMRGRTRRRTRCGPRTTVKMGSRREMRGGRVPKAPGAPRRAGSSKGHEMKVRRRFKVRCESTAGWCGARDACASSAEPGHKQRQG